MKTKHDSGKPSSRLKTCLQNLTLLCGTCVFLFFALELVLSLFVKMEKPTLEYDPLLGLRGRPNVKTIWTREIEDNPRILSLNKFGFHDVRYDLKKDAGTHRVFFLGDSFLEAYQISIEQNLCKILESDFNEQKPKTFPRLQHINGGLHTWGLGSYSLFVKDRLKEWDPDTFVLVLYMGNDILDNYHLSASRAVPQFALKNGKLEMTPPPPFTTKMWLRDNVLGRSSVVKFLWLRVIRFNRKGFNMLRQQGLVGSPNMDLKVLTRKQNLEEVAGIARIQIQQIRDELNKKDIGLFIYIIPVPRYVNYLAGREWHGPDIPESDGPAYLKLLSFQENAFTSFLDSEGIPYVYARDEFVRQVKNGKDVYLSDIGHMNAYGHQVSADLMREPLWDVVAKKSSYNK